MRSLCHLKKFFKKIKKIKKTAAALKLFADFIRTLFLCRILKNWTVPNSDNLYALHSAAARSSLLLTLSIKFWFILTIRWNVRHAVFTTRVSKKRKEEQPPEMATSFGHFSLFLHVKIKWQIKYKRLIWDVNSMHFYSFFMYTREAKKCTFHIKIRRWNLNVK